MKRAPVITATAAATAVAFAAGPAAAQDLAYEGYDYVSHYAELPDGLRMHYVEQGEGQPVVMLHGIPTQAYLWRDVIPEVAGDGRRVIAPDHLNFGLSDKTDPLTPKGHSERFAQFVDALELEDIHLVLHDWGVGIGLMYAAVHPDNVASISFFEGPVSPFPQVMPEVTGFLQMVTGPGSEQRIVDDNWFLDCFLLDPSCAGATIRELTDAEKAVYRGPFEDPASRAQLVLMPRYLPFVDTSGHPLYDPDGLGGDAAQPSPEIEEFLRYAQYLSTDEVPKLFIHGAPGMLPNGEQMGQALQQTYANLSVASVGSADAPVGHFIQEDAPAELGQTVAAFLDGLR